MDDVQHKLLNGARCCNTVVYYVANFHQAVGRLPLSILEGELSARPSAVHEIDSQGRCPLHEAAVRGDPAVVRLLIAHGANPNATDATGETPLMVACRHNRLTVVHVLIRYGALTDVSDLAKRSLMHHAALGNSVLVAYYLLEVCGLSSSVRDWSLQTSLHVACSIGHVDIFLFLLNKERSNLLDRDFQGNTALHLAAMYGHCWHCLELVRRDGCQMLSIRNKDGKMASELARQARHRELSRTLDTLRFEWRRHDHETDVIIGPVKMWYAMIVMPWVLLPIILILKLIFDHAAFFVLFGSIWIGVFDLYCGHRIDNITRWPNPAHASNFAAGFFYNILCFYVLILPELIHKLNLFVVVFTSVLTTVLLALYCRLMTTNPGVCDTSMTNPKTGLAYTVVDVADGADGLSVNFCIRCEVVRPAETVHCRLCNCCYRRRNHHCVYLHRCIAADNQFLFMLFASLSVISMLTFEIFAVCYVVSRHRGNLLHPQLFIDVFYLHPFVWPLFVLNGVCLGWLVIIFGEAFIAYVKLINQEIDRSKSLKRHIQCSA